VDSLRRIFAVPTTLLVEDNTTFRELIREMILDYFPGVTVREAHNSSTTLAEVLDCRPDLIFMDINLDGESGLDLTKEIKSICPSIEIIVLTAYDFPEYREAALAAGASRVLVKSLIMEDDLLLILEEMVSLKKKK
jgi:DNA-binding NarL/FixJ family response regulator